MKIRFYTFLLIILSASLFSIFSPFVAYSSSEEAKEFEKDKMGQTSLPENSVILINADKVDYHQETDTIIATGNVQIAQGVRILHAEKVTYNKKTGLITAAGNVWLKEPESMSISPNPDASKSNEFLRHQDFIIRSLRESGTLIQNPLNLPDLGKQLIDYSTLGEGFATKSITDNVSFAPSVEFTNKFEDGFIRDAKMLMGDDSRLASNTAKRIAGRKVIFRQAVYSPCNVCRLDPQQMPLWQLKADKVIHDKTDKIIVYHHARLEIKGVPVFYMPYFRHADPTVKRKTGFLMPTYAAISDLGTIVSAPYYYVIAPNRDLTLIPIITTKQGPVMVTEYRHRFRDGDLTANGSYTQTRDLKKIPKSSGLPGSDRWHIFTQGRLDIDDDHVATFDINRASDTTYLRRYPILPQGFRLKIPVKNMVSTGAVEQFREHNYATLRATAYQTDNPATTPYVIPHGWYNYQTDPGNWNEIWSMDANLLSLGRRQDTPGRNARHMQRLSLNGGYRLPYVTPTGHAWAFQMFLRGDAYALEHYQLSPTTPILHSAFRGRVFPTATAQWRYPLIKRLETVNWVVEPTAMIVGSPRVNNSTIPNEDSLNIQVEDTSLFLPQRFSGLDRVDTGGRFIYGTNSSWFFPQQRLVQLFLGHSLRLDHTQVLPKHAGENKYASDIVSRFRMNPEENVQLLNRIAWHYKKVRPRISDTSAIFGKKLMIIQLNHTFVNKNSTVNGVGISQATWVVGSQPFDHWSFSVGETRNLKRHQRGALSHTLSALYHDECFRMTLSAFKTRSSDRDIRPNSGVVVQFDFKNLGSVNLLDTIGVNANNIL
ncbi:MAG: LPS-assembly protein LptD [Alphaproteobacteria bacterium]|nr:LPS-assembly protein LptD [Alphaproteobacteria bacterium]